MPILRAAAAILLFSGLFFIPRIAEAESAALPDERAITGQAWAADTMERLRLARYYPEEARMRGVQGTVFVRLDVAADGNILAIKIEQSSQSSLLDDAARKMVSLAAPFARPPLEAGKTHIEVFLPIRFQIPREVSPRCPARSKNKGAAILDGNC